jgi:hypothetical protein
MISNVVSCNESGAALHNIYKPDSVLEFLPNVPVNDAFQDFENNLWFCTRGQGV